MCYNVSCKLALNIWEGGWPLDLWPHVILSIWKQDLQWELTRTLDQIGKSLISSELILHDEFLSTIVMSPEYINLKFQCNKIYYLSILKKVYINLK